VSEKLLYPQRKRCRTCRSYLDVIVLKRLYCCYECAGLPQPSGPVPRQCKNPTGARKRVFFTEDEAMASEPAREDKNLHAYECGYCHFIHLGHPSKDPRPANPAEFAPLVGFVAPWANPRAITL
jgi:hypothetical protein